MAVSIYLAKVGTLQTAIANFVEDATSTSHVATIPIPAGSVIKSIAMQNREAWACSNAISTGGWTVGAGWAESPDETFTHTPGSTAALSHSFAPTIGRTYYVAVPQLSGTAGALVVNFGGVLDIFPNFDGANDDIVYSAFITATSTAGLSIVPATDYDGVLSEVEVLLGPRLTIGDTADTDGYTTTSTDPNFAGSEYLWSQNLNFSEQIAFGNGAYNADESTVGPTVNNFGTYYVAGSNIIATITNPVPSATAGRTSVVVYYSVPVSMPIVSA